MKPLVWIHGFMGGRGQWNLQKKALATHHDFIMIDLPGFGDNTHLDAPETISGFAQFVLDYLDEINVNEFKLLGHSMGGMIAQEMHVISPQRVKQLILYGTTSTGNLPGRFERFETSRKRMIKEGIKASARRISATWFLDYERAKEFNNCAKLAEKSNPQAVFAALKAMESWERTESLQNISCPTTIIWGEADRTYRWPQIETLWLTIPKASLAIIPGCAHAPHMEKPDIFNAIIDDLLR